MVSLDCLGRSGGRFKGVTPQWARLAVLGWTHHGQELFSEIELMALEGARTLLGAKGIATSNKNATRGSWPYY